MLLKLGSKKFLDNYSASLYVDRIIQTTPCGILTGELETLAKDLLKLHPIKGYLYYKGSKEFGIDWITSVARKIEIKSFYTVFHDNTYLWYSWKICLSEKNYSKTVKQVLRQAIAIQAIKYKKKFHTPLYNMEGKQMGWSQYDNQFVPIDELQTDHIYPFANIVQDWLKERNLDIDSIELVINRKHKYVIKNKELEADWFEFHDSKATYRTIKKSSHISLNREKQLVKGLELEKSRK